MESSRLGLDAAAATSLERLAAGLSALVLAGVALAQLLTGDTVGSPPTMVAIFAAAAACGLLAAGQARWLGRRLRVLAPTMLVALSLAVEAGERMASGGAGPTSDEAILAALLVMDVAIGLGVAVAAGVTVVVGAWGLQQALAMRPADALLRTELAGAVTVLQLTVGGVVAGLVVAGFRRSALTAQASADQADRTLAEQRAAEAAQRADAEAARTLHDTALNTLEAIAKSGSLDSPIVRARCRRDVAALGRWRAGHETTELPGGVARIVDHAESLALIADGSCENDAADPGVPPDVVAAMLAAGMEAVTNVAKHAGASRVHVRARVDRQGASLEVIDDGRGMDQAAVPGFGLSESVLARMQGVGGTALVRPAPGGGTSVLLGWRQTAIRDESPGDTGSPELNRVATGVFGWSGVAATAACLLLLGIGWQSFARPGIALLAVGVSAVLLVVVWQAPPSGPVGPLLVAWVFAAVTFAGPLADPYCASVFTERISLDARLAALAVVLLHVSRPVTVVSVLIVVCVSQLAVAEIWEASFPLCGAGSRTAAMAISATAIAVWWFGRIAARMSAATAQARAAALSAQVRAQCAQLARQQRQRWDAAALGRAQGLLADIGSGSVDPAQPGVLEQCARESSYLRGLLLVGRAGPLAGTVRGWLSRMRASGAHVVVRGNFAGFSPPGEVLADVEAVVGWLVPIVGGGGLAHRSCRIDVTAWSDPRGQGFTISSSAAPSQLPPARVGWVDSEDGIVTLGWDWECPCPGGAGSG